MRTVLFLAAVLAAQSVASPASACTINAILGDAIADRFAYPTAVHLRDARGAINQLTDRDLDHAPVLRVHDSITLDSRDELLRLIAGGRPLARLRFDRAAVKAAREGLVLSLYSGRTVRLEVCG
jgi:hypothetical protein